MKKMTALAIAIVFVSGLGVASLGYAYEGYEEGRQWAAANGVIDDDYHDGPTEDFNNGVRQYAIEQQQAQSQQEQ
jgi:hypothetical protein